MRSLRRWWWIPFAALIAIVLKALLVAGMVSTAVRDASIEALGAAGLDSAVEFVGVEGGRSFGADGLDVALRGPASQEEAAVAAVAAREEVDRVSYEVTEDDLAEPEPDPEPEPEPEPEEAPVELDPVSVVAAAAGGQIVLDGLVPDEATRDGLVAAAEAEYGAANVTDNLRIDAEAVTNEGGTILLTGEAESEDQRQQWLAQGTAVATAGGLGVDDQIEVVDQGAAIEASLNDLFQLEPIEFDVNQATIRDSSIPTLDRAAETINDNPEAGRLLVVGHTDGDGAADANQVLSEARARAVVDYLVATGGVDVDRLEFEGRGESELLVDPEVSPEDKQRNRRIAWELLS